MQRRPAIRFSKDYELLDVVTLFRRRDWSSWAELVEWLRTEGPDCSDLTPGEVARLLADFSVLDQEKIPFAGDPGIAYELAQTHRRSVAVREALEWIDQVQSLSQGGNAA